VYHPSGWGGGQTWKKFKWQTFATLPNILPHHLPLRLKNYGIAPDLGAISKNSNYIYRILVSK